MLYIIKLRVKKKKNVTHLSEVHLPSVTWRWQFLSRNATNCPLSGQFMEVLLGQPFNSLSAVTTHSHQTRAAFYSFYFVNHDLIDIQRGAIDPFEKCPSVVDFCSLSIYTHCQSWNGTRNIDNYRFYLTPICKNALSYERF